MENMIKIIVSKREHRLLLEMIDTFTKICANDDKNQDAKELLEDLRNVKKEYAITDSPEPNICD
tara:strand:+ start:6105 stop:6296 length:192 start_codon:yes stop_codon:yes gene_type:complete